MQTKNDWITFFEKTMPLFICFVLTFMAAFCILNVYIQNNNEFDIKVIATGEKNKDSKGAEVWILNIGDSVPPSSTVEKFDKIIVKRDNAIVLTGVKQVEYNFSGRIKKNHILTLLTHGWSGIAKINISGIQFEYDLYSKNKSSIKISKYSLVLKIIKMYLFGFIFISFLIFLIYRKYENVINIIFKKIFLSKIVSSFLIYTLVVGLSLFAIFTSGVILATDNTDAAYYLRNGIAIIRDGFQLSVYPSVLFQLISAVASGGIWSDSPQIVYVAYVSCLVYIVINVYIYKIASSVSNSYIGVISLLVLTQSSYFQIYTQICLRPLTEPWLMLFFVMSLYYAIHQKMFLSALLGGCGLLARTQGLQFVFFTSFFAKSYKKSVIFSLIVIFFYLLIQYCFSMSFNLMATNTDVGFYKNLTWFTYDDLMIFINNFSSSFQHKRLYYVLISLCLFNIIACVFDQKTSKIFKLNLIGLSTIVATFVGSHFILSLLLVHLKWKNIAPDPRYLVYGIPISVIAICCYGLMKFDRFLKFKKKGIIYSFIIVIIFCYYGIDRFEKINIDRTLYSNLVDTTFINIEIPIDSQIAVYGRSSHHFSGLYFRGNKTINLSKYEDFIKSKVDADFILVLSRWARNSVPEGDQWYHAVKSDILIGEGGSQFEKIYSSNTPSFELYIFKKVIK